MSTQTARDLAYNITFKESEKVATLRESLELTGQAKWVFAATRPAVEEKDDFNQHCQNDNREIALLGCLSGGKIYVYEVTDTELQDSNKVTLAHELLHAVWARMSNAKKRQIEPLLSEVLAENKGWFETELESYAEENYLEEVWTRAGTKLANLPDKLEQIYAKYFKNRQKIVGFYQNYEKPFLELEAKTNELLADVMKSLTEIESLKAAYLMENDALEAEIESFNQCAMLEGCFSNDSEFNQKRTVLLEKRATLDLKRDEINAKVDENNAKVKQIEEYQMTLGKMSDILNSHATEKVN